MGKVLGAIVVLVLAVLAAAALAEEPPRDTAAFDAKLEKIATLLGSAASSIKDGGGRTTSGYESPLRDAVGYFREVQDLADEARRLDVENARKIVADHHYESAKAAPDRVADLLEVKHGEVGYRQADFPRQCADAKESLRKHVAEVTASKAHDGADKIRAFAESTARPIREALRSEQGKGATMQARAISATQVTDRQGWGDIHTALATAMRAWDAWQAVDQAAVQACEKVVSWERSDAVRDGIDAVGSHGRTRDQRYVTLTQTLDAVSTYLYEVERDTNESDLLNAQRAADTITAELGSLRAEQGTDLRARTIVEQWPATTERFRSAMSTMVSMKKYQFHVDRAADVCQGQETQLLEKIRRLIDSEPFDQNRKTLMGDADSAALVVKTVIDDKLKLGDDEERAMKAQHESILGFTSGIDEWQKVVKSTHAASLAIYEYYRGAMVEASRACAGLRLGVKNPPVSQVLSGDCDRGDLDTMHEAQIAVCKNYSCTDLKRRDDCAEIKRRTEIAETCISRRRLIMDKCFKGGDAPHRRQLQSVEQVKAACLEKQAQLCS